MRASILDVEPLTVPCQICNAGIGEPCSDLVGNNAPHSARWHDAHRIEFNARQHIAKQPKRKKAKRNDREKSQELERIALEIGRHVLMLMADIVEVITLPNRKTNGDKEKK